MIPVLWLLLAGARAEPVWPEAGAPLHPPALRPAQGTPKVVMLSAGHASSSANRGNTGVHGQIEEQTTLDEVHDLARRLERLGRFRVVLAREGSERPSYDARIAEATRVGASVLVELHSDVRGDLYVWGKLPDGRDAYRVDDDPGFSVLYNDRAPRSAEREALAVAVAKALTSTGFLPYPGCHYTGLYDSHPTAGVYQDRRGLRMLRGPPMPSIIIETHSAVDFEESLRFREERTREAFAAAIASALTDVLYPETP